MPHLWPTGSSWGRPLDYGPVLLRKPFGPHLAMGALSSAVPSWGLQVHLGCVRLSPACPCRCLHTCHLRPARHYPRLWIRPPSSGDRRDLNPPDQCAAWRTPTDLSATLPARPCPHGSSVGCAAPPLRASRVATNPLLHTCHPPIPRRNRSVLASLASRPLAAFPVSTAGRLPQCAFRGLLGVHCTLWPAWLLGRPRRPVASKCFRRCRYLHHPLRLLPAGATVAGRDSHPLRTGALSRRTLRYTLRASHLELGGVDLDLAVEDDRSSTRSG